MGAKSFFFLKKFLQRWCSWQLADAITSEGFPPHYREEERIEERRDRRREEDEKKKLSSCNVGHSFGNLYSTLGLPAKRVCWENEGLCQKTCGRVCGSWYYKTLLFFSGVYYTPYFNAI